MGMRQFQIAPLGRIIAASYTWATLTFSIEPIIPGDVDVPMTFEAGIVAPLLIASTDAKRFTINEDGFVRVDGNERIVTHPGLDAGSLMQPAGIYGALPFDDVDAPNGSGDLLHFTKTVTGDVIEYPGEHTAPDIYGGTGKGVIFTQSASGTGRFRAINGKLTGVVAGDVIRLHGFVRVSDVAGAGTIALRQYGQAAALNLTHDASGAISGTNANWATTRADVSPFPVTLGGQQFYYVWWDRIATGTADIDFGVDFVDTIGGRKIHLQSLHWQKNPTDAAAAVPVTLSGNYGGDAISTGITTQVGFVLHGADSARSIAAGGVITPPSINRGIGYLPIVTRVDVLNTPLELVDRGGIMPNENQLLYSRPWQTPGTLNLFYGPGWFSRRYYQALGNSENAGTINFRSVFQSRRDLYAKFGQLKTSSSRLGSISFDRVIALPTGDTRSEYWQQTNIGSGDNASYRLFADNNVGFTNSLAFGHDMYQTRGRFAVQADETPEKRVNMGELVLETQTGGVLDLTDSHTHNMGRTTIFGGAQETPINLITTNFGGTRFWMDLLYIGRGTLSSWNGNQMFGGLTTAYQTLFCCQTEQPIRVSQDGGDTWEDLDASGLTVPELPHGFLGEYIGTMDFDTGVITPGTDATKTLPIRYWYPDNSHPDVFGFQYHASQMDMGTHKRWPDSGDVFRIKKGDLWLDVPYQAGRYLAGDPPTYSRTVTSGQPATSASGISNDFIQINRTSVTMVSETTLVGCVWIGPKGGFFLTGNPQLNDTGSRISNITVQNYIGLHNGTNAYRFDWSKEDDSVAFLRNSVAIECASDRTLLDGSGRDMTIGAAGPNNTLTFENVTVFSSANVGGLANADSGATYVDAGEVRTVLTGRRSNFDEFTAPDAEVEQYLPGLFNAAQGRPNLPTFDELWTFEFSEFAESYSGLSLNATLNAAREPKAVWLPLIADYTSKFGQVPAATVMVYADTAVGATLATGLNGSGFDMFDSGNEEGFFALTEGALTLAKSMAGVDHVFCLLTAAGQRVIVDKVLTDASVVDVEPEITASSIAGTPEDGEVLTANATVTGTPEPTLAYQWQNNGANISGETASTITLDADTMSLSNGDTISCEITATNSEGTDTAEPTITFVADVLTELLALVDAAGGYSGVHDFTDATNTGTWTSEDLSANSRDFTQATAANQPGISATLGATFDGADSVDQTIDGGTFTIVMSLIKDASSTTGTIISDQGQAVLVQYNDGSALTFAGSTVSVNGATMADRNELHDSMSTAEVLLKSAGLAMTGDTSLRIGGRPTAGLAGSIRRIVVLEHGTLGGDLAEAVTLAETWAVAS